MWKCPNCGRENGDNDIFCECGSNLSSDVEDITPEGSASSYDDEPVLDDAAEINDDLAFKYFDDLDNEYSELDGDDKTDFTDIDDNALGIPDKTGVEVMDDDSIDDDVKIFVSDEYKKSSVISPENDDTPHDFTMDSFGNIENDGTYNVSDGSDNTDGRSAPDLKTENKVAPSVKSTSQSLTRKANQTAYLDEAKKQHSKHRGSSPDDTDDRFISGGRGGLSNMSFIIMLLALIVITTGLSILYIQKTFPGNTLGDKINYIAHSTFTDDLITKSPTIVPDPENDGMIIITVYARKGSMVRFCEGNTSTECTVSGQSVSFRVPTSLWTASAETGATDTLLIEPNIFVYDPTRSYDIVKVSFDQPYSTDIKHVNISITAPTDNDVFTTSSDTVRIEGKVDDPSVALFMNGTELQLNANGIFKTSYYVSEEAEQKVVFTAQKNGYVVGAKTLTINYTESNVGIELYNESFRTYDGTLTVEGKVDRGIDMSVPDTYLDGELELHSSGRFEFTLKFSDEGNYPITIILTDGDEDSSITIFAEYAPDREEYTAHVRTLDYDRLKEHSTMDYHLSVSGTVEEIYRSKPYTRALFRTSEGDMLVIEYYDTDIDWKVGNNYHIYFDARGDDSSTGYPSVYCWFVYSV